MTEAAHFWDGIAERYARQPIRDVDAYEYTLGRTRSHLKQDDRVLELGCGTGSTALRLADAVGSMVATDLSSRMIDIAKAKADTEGVDNVAFQTAELSSLKAPDTPYDAVLALNLMHLVQEPEAALRHIHGLLKPGGAFISKTVCKSETGGPWWYPLMSLALPVMRLLGKAPFVRFSSIADWEAMVIASGFRIVESGNHPAKPLASRYLVAIRVP